MAPADSTKDSLLAAAKKIFAVKGFDGATVKDIADEAEVNVSLVSYHFNGKENLYRACLEEFGMHRLEVTERLFRNPPENREDFKVRIKIFIEEFIEDARKEPHITQIILRECASENPIVRELFSGFFIKAFTIMEQFVKSAQEKNIAKSGVDVHVGLMMFMGGLCQTVRLDGLHKELFQTSLMNPDFRQNFIDNAARFFLEGLSV